MRGQLTIPQATWVVARRDFLAMVMSKMYLVFLFGPLFSIMIMGLVSAILIKGEARIEPPRLLVVMNESDADKINLAYGIINKQTSLMPDMILAPGKSLTKTEIKEVLLNPDMNLSGVLHGSLRNPEVTAFATEDSKLRTVGNLLVAEARRNEGQSAASYYPDIQPNLVSRENGISQRGGFLSSKLTQFALYILTSTMAVMILSNLAEEKSNRIVEVLATAIPMEALFAGKLLSMLAAIGIAITLWIGVAAFLWSLAGASLSDAGVAVKPQIGWTAFISLFAFYFAASYLFVGAVYLTIGGISPNARDAQGFAMPASILQIVAFLLGTWGSSAPGMAPWIIASIPVASPYLLAGYAAENSGYTIHIYGIIVQIVFVSLAIKYGSKAFRKRIVDSGSPMTISLFKSKEVLK